MNDAEALALLAASALLLRQGNSAPVARILVVKVSARVAFNVTTLCTVAQLQVTTPYPPGSLVTWTVPTEGPLTLDADRANTYSVHEPFTGTVVVEPPPGPGAMRLVLTIQ